MTQIKIKDPTDVEDLPLAPPLPDRGHPRQSQAMIATLPRSESGRIPTNKILVFQTPDNGGDYCANLLQR